MNPSLILTLALQESLKSLNHLLKRWPRRLKICVKELTLNTVMRKPELISFKNLFCPLLIFFLQLAVTHIAMQQSINKSFDSVLEDTPCRHHTLAKYLL